MNSKQTRHEKKKDIIEKINEIDLKIETYSKFGEMEIVKKLKTKKKGLELMLNRLEVNNED